jgi:hypothetical protein
MNEPVPPSGHAPLPPLPQPFGPVPRSLQSGPGCGKGLWIGCGALLLLFLVAAVGLTFRADEMMVWMLGRLEEKVAAKLPADLAPAERERFAASFEDLRRSVERGRVDPPALQALQRKLFEISGDVERGLTREQVLELTEATERAAGVPPGDEATGQEPSRAP